MSHLCLSLKEKGIKKLVSSSGGNAGLAVSTVAASLDMAVDVIVPSSTKPMIISKLKSLVSNAWEFASTL